MKEVKRTADLKPRALNAAIDGDEGVGSKVEILEAEIMEDRLDENAITRAQWHGMFAKERDAAVEGRFSLKALQMERSDDKEFAHWRWDPVTGCDSINAVRIGDRFCPKGLTPCLHPDQLALPRRNAVPAGAQKHPARKNVMTCSTGDLFGPWVPDQWIEAVLRAIRDAPQWTFLLWTKYPRRTASFKFPDHAWIVRFPTVVSVSARQRRS